MQPGATMASPSDPDLPETRPAPAQLQVLVAEFCAPSGLNTLAAAGLAVIYAPEAARDPAALRRLLPKAHALIVRNQVRVDEGLLAWGPHLQVIGRLGAGLDNIDPAAITRRRIPVVYAPGMNARAVAEFVVAQMLALARRLPEAAHWGATGHWPRQRLVGRELAGCHVGILGLGRVGRELVPLLRPLVARVSTHHPRRGPDHPLWRTLGVHWLPLEQLLPSVDYLVVLLPLRADTRLYLNDQRLQQLKPGARLVVAGRGGVVDERALAQLLASGHLAGAALDVRAVEPPGPEDALRGLPNVLLTPHVAGLTLEAQERVALSVCQDVVRVLRGQEPRHVAWS